MARKSVSSQNQSMLSLKQKRAKVAGGKTKSSGVAKFAIGGRVEN